MKILKFGGTSVANSKNIAQVVSIVSNVNEKNVVVVSALGGVTDLLLEALYIAASGDSNFVDTLKKIEERHLEPIRASIPAQSQSSSISFLKSELNHLETILEGVMMLKETTPRTIAKVSSYGEILSSNIINEIFKVNNIDVALKDGRDLKLKFKEINLLLIGVLPRIKLMPFLKATIQKLH
jgi:aspartokinase/homoserine dehydrogenase 1